MNKEKKDPVDLQSRQFSDEVMLDEMPGATPPKISRIKDLIVDPPAEVADIVHRYRDQKANELDVDSDSNPGPTKNTRGR